MLYIHYCKTCDKVHILNGHKTVCPGCEGSLEELPVSFLQYTEYDEEKREMLVRRYRHNEQVAIKP